jgi:glycosyltransferase involved in cell wall biosynthesis
VLIPAYDAAETIGEAVESALTQAPPPFEVVVSDDGSRDQFDVALRPFRDHVRIVRGPNAGLAVARNRAATVARGDLLAMLDADDVWLPGRVAAFSAAAAARPDLAVLTTDAIIVRDGQPETDTYYATRHFYVEEQGIGILRNSFIFGAGAVRADVFQAAGGYRVGARFAEDWDLWLRLLLGGHAAGLIDLPLYEYRRRGESLTAQKIELAVGVLDVLHRARTLVSTPGQRFQLQATTQEWREAAARAAERLGDRRARGLALRAAVGSRARPRARVRFAAAALLPARVLADRGGAQSACGQGL